MRLWLFGTGDLGKLKKAFGEAGVRHWRKGNYQSFSSFEMPISTGVG